ncbi:hypothetical protein TorRG33x02_063100 [Trema orientale]|uniref:Uncharacterized protein n=1 Tax=Trema orientale TaxID=63057 RepID=A0A2P5FJM2_TREOI|nr:hypothetical protein TorRG33x02_063100 [Trema orientale]
MKGYYGLAHGPARPDPRAGPAQPTYRIARGLGYATIFLRWARPDRSTKIIGWASAACSPRWACLKWARPGRARLGGPFLHF